jgi:hypothetical protein
MRLLATAIVFACLSAGLAAAQAPRDARPARTGAASLSGRVVSADPEARPVRHARVTCTEPELAGGVSVTTDQDGRFTCANVPPGRYTVAVTRDGWVPSAYGAVRPLRPGRPIVIGAGEHAEIVVPMTRGAVITGVLLDEHGQPAINTTVVALRSVMQNGERRLVALGRGGVADDRGVYRIYGLPPGDYFVRAVPPGSLSGQSDLVETTDRHVAFAPTYFPGTPIAVQATALPVRGGEEREGIDFAIQKVATARIEGVVSPSDRTAVPGGTILSLIPARDNSSPDPDPTTVRAVQIPADGSFSFSSVTPGVYTLLARAPQPRVAWASAEVAVEGEAVPGLALTLQPAMTISGELRFARSHLPVPVDFTGWRITAEPEHPTGGATLVPEAATIDRDGRFVIGGVTPGAYRLTATPAAGARTAGWTLRSAMIDGIETLDQPVAIQPTAVAPQAIVTFTDTPASLGGRLQGVASADGFVVVLFPTDRALWRPHARRIQSSVVSTDGTYSFTNVAPGEYWIAPVSDAEPGEWFDPAFLQRLLPGGTKLAIREGERKTLDVRADGGG